MQFVIVFFTLIWVKKGYKRPETDIFEALCLFDHR